MRVRNDSCAVHEDFQNAIKVCYNEYSEDIEDKEPFLLGSREKTSAQAYVDNYHTTIYFSSQRTDAEILTELFVFIFSQMEISIE